MDSTDSAYSALDAIDTVAFKIGVRGYNVDEVDDFLEQLSGEVHQLKELVAQQRQQLRQAGERINQLDTRGRATPRRRAGARASGRAAPRQRLGRRTGDGDDRHGPAVHRTGPDTKPRTRRARLTTGAQERAREIVAEARSRAEDEVNRLNGLKQRLSEDVETLTRQLDSERKRLSGALAEFSRWVESSLQVGGARASVAVGARTGTATDQATAGAGADRRIRASVRY